MKKENPDGQDVDYQPKKSKKSKATPQIVPNRSTRRGKRKQSEEQFVLPQQIPRSDGNELLCFASYQCEISHLILQIPMALCLAESFDLKEQNRVENNMIIIRVTKQSDNMICSMLLHEEVMYDNKNLIFNINGKYSWLTQKQILTKIIKSSRKSLNNNQWNQLFRFKISELKSDIFIVLTIRQQQEENNQFAGLVNQGNTCYMNSYLQMLFHLNQFRKMVFTCETKQKEKFPATLQLLFSKMLKQKKAVSPQQLIKSFGWSKKQVQIQQDAQEFSCLFFEALERTLGYINNKWGSVREFFCGQIMHYIQCCNLGIVFEILTIGLRIDNSFMICNCLLQILQHRPLMIMQDNRFQKKTTHIEHNNMVYNQLEKVYYSNLGLKISYLPPVLMIQLKRFQFNPYTQSNQKILDRFNYPQQISFSAWTLNPQKKEIYQLYSVLVHEGGQASSGHYYAYININSQWYRFNDEIVVKVTRQKALDYNFGGYNSIVEYDAKQMKISTRQIQNKRTAYMLVYIRKQFKDQLLYNQLQKSVLPAWIDQYNKNKQNFQQQKKLRKQSICDVFIYNWNKYFLNKQSQGNGLSVKEVEDQKDYQQQKLQMIPKNLKMDEWISQLQSKIIDELYVYVYWVSNDKQILINAKARNCNYVHELFKQTFDPSLILFPVYAGRQQFLIIVKQFYSKDQQNSLRYISCTKINKISTYKELYEHIKQNYKSTQNDNYYIEDKKIGLIKIDQNNLSLLPAIAPSKNQLLIVVIEKIIDSQQSNKIHKFYRDEKDTVQVIFRSETSKIDYQFYLNKNISIEQIRRLIYDTIKDQQTCESQHNIILKYKIKKNSKPSIQALNKSKLSDLIKSDRIVHYSISNLKADERIHRKQLNFCCRKQDNLKLSEPIQIIIEKTQNHEKILQQIFNHIQKLNIFQIKDGFKLRTFLLGKDRCFINDLIDQRGYISGKTQLSTVLQREKNSILIVEQYKMTPQIKSQVMVNILVHHLTKTNERLGNPRWLQVSKKIKLSKLKYLIIQEIQNDILEFEGKFYNVNPLKARLLAYVKDLSKSVQLPQPEDFQQIIQEEEFINVDGQSKKDVQEEEQQKKLTIQDHFAKNKIVRVAVVHNFITKGSQLKLNVQ